MNYSLFCLILNDNLVYEFSDNVSPEDREEYQQEWYIEFRESRFSNDPALSSTEQVVCWMREAFNQFSFDTHSFCLKAP